VSYHGGVGSSMRIGRIGYAVGTLSVVGILYACDHFNIGMTDGEPNRLSGYVFIVGAIVWLYFLTVLRCHDYDESVWTNYAIENTPVIGQLWSTVELFIKPGTPGPNRFGRPPLI
jgi:uncharacterized membrane protein YhaH (DUF805 family)